MINKQKIIIVLGLIFCSIILGFALALFFPQQINQNKIEVVIPTNSSVRQIANILYDKGLISSRTAFIFFTRFLKADNNLRAGKFFISSNYSLKKIINILQEKEGAASLIKITIPEGSAIADIAEILERKELIASANEFISYVHKNAKTTFSGKYNFIKYIPTSNVEGYLFPETYFFSVGVSPEIILNKFLQMFDEKIYAIWKMERQNQTLPLHKIVTLASIIEKEVYLVEEMPLISSVYHNRLAKRMFLDSCPTVLYAIGDRKKTVLYYKDLDFPSLYNTYRNYGLPPTPIASPGKTAFLAALKPEKSDYLFFFAKSDRKHYFSKTLQKHLQLQNSVN